jgi:hypothetical protein
MTRAGPGAEHEGQSHGASVDEEEEEEEDIRTAGYTQPCTREYDSTHCKLTDLHDRHYNAKPRSRERIAADIFDDYILNGRPACCGFV